MRKIALDPGFGGFKVAEVCGSKINVEVLPSVVGIGTTDTGALSVGKRRGKSATLTVSFEDVSYLVGHGVHKYARPVERLDFHRLSEGPELRAMLYASLWKIINGGSHELGLMIGLPVEVLQDTDQARATLRGLRDWLLGEHRFVVNGQEAGAVVRQIKAVAQPVGAYSNWGRDLTGAWIRGAEGIKAPVAIADFGFNTLDLFAVEKGEVIGRYTGGDKLGMRRAAEMLAANIRRAYDVDLSLHEADQYLRGEETTLYHAAGEANVRPLVQQALDSAAAQALSFIERQWDNAKRFRHLLVTGGGAEALRREITKRYPLAVVMDRPVVANAEGLAKYAQRPGVF